MAATPLWAVGDLWVAQIERVPRRRGLYVDCILFRTQLNSLSVWGYVGGGGGWGLSWQQGGGTRHTTSLSWLLAEGGLARLIGCGLSPLPHCGRPFWPYTSRNSNYSKSAEGIVLPKIKYSSSSIFCFFWNHNFTKLGPNEAVINFFPIHSKRVGHE